MSPSWSLTVAPSVDEDSNGSDGESKNGHCDDDDDDGGHVSGLLCWATQQTNQDNGNLVWIQTLNTFVCFLVSIFIAAYLDIITVSLNIEHTWPINLTLIDLYIDTPAIKLFHPLIF